MVATWRLAAALGRRPVRVVWCRVRGARRVVRAGGTPDSSLDRGVAFRPSIPAGSHIGPSIGRAAYSKGRGATLRSSQVLAGPAAAVAVAYMTTIPDTASVAAIDRDRLAAATPIPLGAPTERGPDIAQLTERPVSVRRLVTRFALAGLPVLAAAIVVTAIASVRIGTKLGIDDAKRVSFVATKLVNDHVLDDRIVTMDPAAILEMDRFVHDYVLTDKLTIVKIHAADGTVLYSNETALIGQKFPFDDEVISVLDHREEVAASISELDKKETRSRWTIDCWRSIAEPRHRRARHCCSRPTFRTARCAIRAATSGVSSLPSPWVR